MVRASEIAAPAIKIDLKAPAFPHEMTTIEPFAVTLLLECHDQTTINLPAFLFGAMPTAGGSQMSQTKQSSAYAPAKADPLRLANATIQAVDRIGETTSGEIEKTAKEITQGAAEIAEKLQELANAIREHSKIANEHVTQFCEKATSVFDGIRDLQQALEVKERKAETGAVDEDILPMPVFLNNGPSVLDDHSFKGNKGNAATTGINDFTFQRRL
jgi:hypothetical protein